MKKELCINCSVPMKKAFVKYKGVKLETRECPKCKQKIFTEDLTMRAISKLEARKLEEVYIKYPIKIGHSLGITFPKGIVDVFSLNKRVKLKVHPNINKGKIEIRI